MHGMGQSAQKLRNSGDSGLRGLRVGRCGPVLFREFLKCLSWQPSCFGFGGVIQPQLLLLQALQIFPELLRKTLKPSLVFSSTSLGPAASFFLLLPEPSAASFFLLLPEPSAALTLWLIFFLYFFIF